MSNPDKPTEESSADTAASEESAKELTAEQLESVAGGARPAPASDIFIKIGDIKGAFKVIGDGHKVMEEEGLAPLGKK